MECGVPFCHNGCPLGNLIPDWNDLVYRDRWREAIVQLHATNNFPEFTGQALPRAVRGGVRAGDPRGRRGRDQADRGLDRQPRLGRGLDRAAAAAGRDRPHRGRDRRRARPGWPPRSSCAAPATRSPSTSATRPAAAWSASACRTSRSRSGSSSAGSSSWPPRACEFRYGVDVGVDVDAAELRAAHDAVVIATGSRVPRDLPVPGRELDGVHFAMEYLYDRARCAATGNAAGEPDHGRRQARAGRRRRRHRRRLRRPLAPRGRRVGDADRAARRAARARARTTSRRGRAGP